MDPIRPSAAGYWIGGGILVVSVAASVVILVQAAFGFIGNIDEFDRVGVGESETIELDDGEWVIYWEPDVGTTFADETLADFDIEVSPADAGESDADDLLVGPRSESETYSDGAREGYSIGDFHVAEAGDYVISVGQGDSQLSGSDESDFTATDGEIAIGRPLFESVFVRIGLSFLIGAAGFIVGLIIMIVTAVRRGKAKRSRFPPNPYGFGTPPPVYPAGAAGPSPAPGYGMPPPSGGAQPWGPPPSSPAPTPPPLDEQWPPTSPIS
jgi:hypothetical protein